ncbi:MAG: TonB-dependent receptor [Chitinophagia bacterium]|nr:TonB-dependent receptor [Chitinophagia bacterium]
MLFYCKQFLGLFCCYFVVLFPAVAQQDSSRTMGDSLRALPAVVVVSRPSSNEFQFMPEVSGTNIFAGKKQAQIQIQQVLGNISANNLRQVLAKIPGIHVWESDPSGIQTGIAARGLSPNRSWEFNMRQNGYDIASDPYGYPEAYYTPPLAAVQRMEIVRGQGALQYGPQMGGMVNYILANGSECKSPLEIKFLQTAGSFNRNHSFISVGGKRATHYGSAWIDYQLGEGGRQNSRFSTFTGFGTYTRIFTNQLKVTWEMLGHQQLSQQPGGLTDSQFERDPYQSVRSRNWMGIQWFIPAISISCQPNEKIQWETKISAVIGNRNSVGLLTPIQLPDSINPITVSYHPRVVAIDQYRNLSFESKVLMKYSFAGQVNTLLTGMRLFSGQTHRWGNGKGSIESDYQLSIAGSFPQDLLFHSYNAAWFVENIIPITSRLKLIPGIRTEWIRTQAKGRLSYSAAGNEQLIQEMQRDRYFLLAGLGAEYHFSPSSELYMGWAQSYRPMQFSNLQAAPITDIVDPALKDASGYNFDVGYRGKLRRWLQVDASLFYLQYNNRIGIISQPGINNRLITNVGNSVSKGLEALIDWNLSQWLHPSSRHEWSVFASYSYTDARYSRQHADKKIAGNRVENAPQHILRTGTSFSIQPVSFSFQFSYVDEAYSDANNTVSPSANAQSGLIPSYRLIDITSQVQVSKSCTIQVGINNLLDERYFTRRASGYPGPGVIPAVGTNGFITASIKL